MWIISLKRKENIKYADSGLTVLRSSAFNAQKLSSFSTEEKLLYPMGGIIFLLF